MENKLYCLKEECHRINHCDLFNDQEYKEFDKNLTFTTGILLFNNNIIIKNLFSRILLHINNHINNITSYYLTPK